MVDDEVWAQRVSARLAMFGVKTSHTPQGDSIINSELDISSQSADRSRGEGDDALFPSCFYAQMLSVLPNSHRSVSVPPSPRASIAVDEQKDSQRLASRILTHTRKANTKREPKPLLEEIDTAVLAKAQALNNDLNEMLQWAQKRNQRSLELRRQLEHSRLVRYVGDIEVPKEK